MTVLKKEGGAVDFRDVYQVGNRLGAGAFGTVYECMKKRKPDGITYAVKMMEHQSSWWGRLSSTQEAQWQTFAQEFQMLKAVSHPQLVRMVGVFLDDYFVYLVMDKYETSLINALLPMLKKSPNGLSHALMGEIMLQMLESIAYMHSMMIVHRDVKADNYLVDTTEFKGKFFKVVLTDLSTARYLEDGVYLKDIVGTREYWAPELITRSYAHKVDVWALGVIMWCMITAKFPFSTMQERFTKVLKKHESMNSQQFELINQFLHMSHQQRISASDALENQWVIQQSKRHRDSAKASTVEADDPGNVGGAKDVDDGTKGFGATRQSAMPGQAVAEGGGEEQRFAAKMKLAVEKHESGEKSAVAIEAKVQQLQAGADKVTSIQRVGESKAYEWWSEQRCIEKKVPDIQTKCLRAAAGATASENTANMESGDAVVGEPASVEWLEKFFKSLNIDTSLWGKNQAKGMPNLFHELSTHECSLLIRGGKLIRMVDLVVVRIQTKDGKFLVEASQTFSDGRDRAVKKFPAVMCRAKGKGRESARFEIERLLENEIQTTSEVVNLNLEGNLLSEMVVEKVESQSYPGLESVYRKFFFTATINEAASPSKLMAVGLPSGSGFKTHLEDGTECKWEWWDTQKCLSSSLPVKVQSVVQSEFEGYQLVPGHDWTEDKLVTLLQRHKIDTKLYGTTNARTVSQLATEVNSGETQLYEKPDSPGELRRYLEILIVRVQNQSGACMVETSHSFGQTKRERNLFPATKVRPFEDSIWAVRRLLSELDIPFASAKTTFGPRRTETSSSPSYPNILTVYLKQVVEVTLEDIALENLENQDIAAKWYDTRRV
jgi:hypothetical protein